MAKETTIKTYLGFLTMWHIQVLERYQNQIVFVHSCLGQEYRCHGLDAREHQVWSHKRKRWMPLSPYSALFTPVRECTFDTFSEQCCKFQWTGVGWVGVCIIWQKKLWRKAKLAFVPRHKPFIPAAWQSIPPLRCKLTPYESWTMTFFFFLVRELNVTWLHQKSENMFNFSKRSDGWT